MVVKAWVVVVVFVFEVSSDDVVVCVVVLYNIGINVPEVISVVNSSFKSVV